MTKFERLLEAKNEAEKLGAKLIKKYPEKKEILTSIVLKYVCLFENFGEKYASKN